MLKYQIFNVYIVNRLKPSKLNLSKFLFQNVEVKMFNFFL